MAGTAKPASVPPPDSDLHLDDIEGRRRLTFDTYGSLASYNLDECLERAGFQPTAYVRPRIPFQFHVCLLRKRTLQMIQLIPDGKEALPPTDCGGKDNGRIRELNAYRIRTYRCRAKRWISLSHPVCCITGNLVPGCFSDRTGCIARDGLKQWSQPDDRPMFIEVARSPGIHGIRHIDTATTRFELAKFGFAE